MSVLSGLRGRLSKARTNEEPDDVAPSGPDVVGPVEPVIVHPPETAPEDWYALSTTQLAFFDTFGFLRVPGLIADQVGALRDAFDPDAPHPIDLDVLGQIADDPGVRGVLFGLFGARPYEQWRGDGEVLACGTSWHLDIEEGAEDRHHVRLAVDLDGREGRGPAVQMIPGTNHWGSPYAARLRRDLGDRGAVAELYGVPADEIPSWTVETEAGDVVIWNAYTSHARDGSDAGRRLFAFDVREAPGASPEATTP